MHRTSEFKSTFPDEWQFDERGNPILPGGRDIADAIVAWLRKTGAAVTHVQQYEYYGWGFETICNDSTFYNVVNSAGGRCYLTVTMDWYWLKWLLLTRPRRSLDEYCRRLNEGLSTIPQISEICWQN